MQKHSALVAIVAAFAIVGGISAKEHKKHTKQAPEMTKEERANQVTFYNHEGFGPFGRKAFTIKAQYNRGEMTFTVQKIHAKGDNATLLYNDPEKGLLQDITISSPATTKVTVVKAENLRGDCNEYVVKFNDKTKIWIVEKKEAKKTKESKEKVK